MTTFRSPTEKKSSYFLPNLCRLCSLVSDKVLPIFDNSGSQVDVKIKLSLPSLTISQKDGKPQQICLDCITKLNLHSEFILLCLASDKQFESFLNECQQNEAQLLETLNSVLDDDFSTSVAPAGQSESASSELILLSDVQPNVNPNSGNESTDGNIVVVVEFKYKEGDDTREENTNADPEPSLLENVGISQEIEKITESAPLDEPPSYRFDSETKEFICSLCCKGFKRKTRLNGHLAKHRNICPYKCDQCSESFVFRGDLTIHQRLHNAEFACSICSKSFVSKSKLERHSFTHSKDKPFVCSICSKGFSDKANLRAHVRLHSGTRPFKCSICSTNFSTKSHMVAHLAVHQEIKPIRCLECKRSFKWKTNYNKHMKNEHKPK